ncbi:MAG: hypothetical protein B6247_02250 [Candidatus Parabeggiatoa sp. nov. 2]|nr:MAG: hypothetical protein B6247_02250 [Beggiatoa sp. 4572_84]
MKLSFRLKIGLAISLLAVSMTSTSVYFFYSNTYSIVLNQMTKRLKDVGRTGTFLLDEQARAYIKKITKALEQDSLPITPDRLDIEEGDTAFSLAPEVAEKYIASTDFQELVQRLRQIKEASRQQIVPLRHIDSSSVDSSLDPPLLHYVYILVKMPQSPQGNILKFIADADYEDDTPPGTLYAIDKTEVSIFMEAFQKGEAKATNVFTPDKWGIFLTAIIPIKDKHNNVIAVLGLDVDVASEANQLYKLKFISLTIIGISLILSLLVAYLMARLLTRPIAKLRNGAEQVRLGNFDTVIVIKSHDEFELLANSFNSMAKQLKVFFETLETKNLELRQMDQLKDDFLANTSHEIRTPLNGIIGIAESLIEGATGELPESTQSNLAMIADSGRRLAHLVNDILDFSKLKQKNLDLQLKPVGVREITEVVLAFSQPLVAQKEVQLINAVPPDLPLAHADENRLQQILFNLVGNAIKFTHRGSVVVAADIVENPKPFLAIKVYDTGIGIPEDKLDKIFQSFEQADGGTAREYGGTGLGLTVSKQLVELHGGQIGVESTVGKGSCFFFSLPFSEGRLEYRQASFSQLNRQSLADSNQSLSVTSVQPVFEAVGDIKILIVDDEPVNRQVLVNHLSLQHYVVVQVTNGMETLELIQADFKPDLVLLDVMMPKMTGYEVCRQLREQFSRNELPILMLTAKNQVSDMVEGFEAGANDYLTKPISKDELLARVKTHLENAKLYAEVQKSEKTLTQFLEAMPVGVFVVDANGQPHYINRTAQQIFGKGVVSDVTIDKLAEVYQAYLADTNQMYPTERQPLVRALKGEKTNIEDMEIHQGDKIIPIEAWGTPIYDEHDNMTYAIAAIQDITERKRAEAERIRLERLKAENLRLSTELNIARQLQQMVLPTEEELNQVAGLEIAAFMEPADEVGGDYYDVLQHEGRVICGIGDATGHGLESGLLMLMVQTAVRTLLVNNVTNPVQFLSVINRMIYDNLQRMKVNKNLTLALLDYSNNQLRLSGLHEEMIVVRSGGIIERIDTIPLGFAIGLVDDIAEMIAEQTVSLNAGDVVILYTDGITEAENIEGKLYGLERLCEIARQHWQHSASEIRQAIINDVRQYIGEQKVFDDITLLILKQIGDNSSG